MSETSSATSQGLAALLLWSSLPAMAAWLGPVPAMQMNMIAFGVAFVMYLIIWMFQKRPLIEQCKLPIPVWLLGVYGIFGFHLCYFLAFRMAPPVEAFLVVEFWPLMLLFLSSAFAHTPLKPAHYLGALAATLGVICAISKGELQNLWFDWSIGHVLGVLSAFIWASYSVLSRRYSEKVPEYAVGMFCGISAVLSGIMHLATESWQALTLLQWVVILAMGFGSMGIAFVWWHHGMQRGNVAVLSICAFGVPIVGTTSLVALGFSTATPSLAIGALLVTLGGVLGSDIRWKKLLLRSR